MPVAPDAVPVDSYIKQHILPTNLKSMIIMFIIFMVIVSEVFSNSVITIFGDSAISGGKIKTWGVVLQGIFLVIGYSLAVHCINNDML